MVGHMEVGVFLIENNFVLQYVLIMEGQLEYAWYTGNVLQPYLRLQGISSDFNDFVMLGHFFTYLGGLAIYA